MLAWWLVIRGTRPVLHKVQPTQTLGFRSNLTPPLPSPPSISASVHISAQECWPVFFAGNETLLCSEGERRFSLPPFPGSFSPPIPLPQREGGRKEWDELSPRLFEVWEVKITGTASRLNRRFHLSGRIKAAAAGAHTPYSPLTPPPVPSLRAHEHWGFFRCH